MPSFIQADMGPSPWMKSGCPKARLWLTCTMIRCSMKGRVRVVAHRPRRRIGPFDRMAHPEDGRTESHTPLTGAAGKPIPPSLSMGCSDQTTRERRRKSLLSGLSIVRVENPHMKLGTAMLGSIQLSRRDLPLDFLPSLRHPPSSTLRAG